MNNSKIISKVLLSLSLFTVGASAFVIQDELMQKNHAKAEVSAEEIKNMKRNGISTMVSMHLIYQKSFLVKLMKKIDKSIHIIL